MPMSPLERIQLAAKSPCCIGCGACVAADRSKTAVMRDTAFGPVPQNLEQADLPDWITAACPAIGVHYPDLYRQHYGTLPENALTGVLQHVRTGFAADPEIRQCGASGGVLTCVLCHLLDSGKVDAVIAVKQGTPTPEQARSVICDTKSDILACAQSVYIPVATLDILHTLAPGKRYAMVCLPDQAAALRFMQQNGHEAARQVRFVVGPYTGTALYPAAIRGFLKANGISGKDTITRLQWRAGDWPGYLEISTASGRTVRSPKVYYNFLIPFFITQASLQSMDFSNEFADLAVGDAWSPKFESEGGGHSVFVTRTAEMETIIAQMCAKKLLTAEVVEPLKAAEMHGHMLDFKKRGAYLRNRWRRMTGRPAPTYGYRPSQMPVSRILVEIVINTIFAVGRTRIARWTVTLIPERIIGPVFNHLRLGWKAASRPTKRKGLNNFKLRET